MLRTLCLVLLAGCVVEPAPAYPPPAQATLDARVSVGVQFFGVPLAGAQDVVFVLDRSGSMDGVAAGFSGAQVGMSATKSFFAGLGAEVANDLTGHHVPTKLAAAKAELIQTLRALPDGTRCNVIWFDDEIATPAQHLIVLSPGTRAELERFVARIKTGGSTAAVPALALAYQMGAARVVLLSDGLANTGGDGDTLLASAREQMRRGVRFDTVGLGIDQDSALLRELAAESGGIAITR